MRHGGVSCFVLYNPLEFPRLVGLLRLRSFKIEITKAAGKGNHIMPGIDLPLLGANLENLVLNFPTALAKLDQLAAPLSSVFPQLKTLSVESHMNVPDFPQEGWFGGLPRSLRHLALPRTLPIAFEYISTLPCYLESLKINLLTFKYDPEPQEQRFVSCSALAHLTTLDLTTELYVRWTHFVPSSVLHFSWQTKFQSDPKLAAVTQEDMEKLPRSLLSLCILWHIPNDYNMLRYLPKSLTSLQITTSFSYHLKTVDFVPFLPQNLRFLKTPPFTPDWDHALPPKSAQLLINSIDHFPPHLESWRECIVFDRLAAMPKSMKSLSLARLTTENVCFLPPHLEELCVLGDTFIMTEDLVKLPSLLTMLDLHTNKFSPVGVANLPKSLTKLSVVTKILDLEYNDDEDWLEVWPPRLNELNLRVLKRDREFGPYFWTYLPKHLTNLELSLVDFANFPETSEFLPRTLTSCSLGVNNHKALIDTSAMDPPVLTDAFFNQLPPSLVSLSFSDFYPKLTSKFCLNLPRKLRHLDFEHDQSWLAYNHPDFPDFDSDGAASPLLWDFLDKLPPFLDISYFGERTVGFAEYLSLRLEDDLIEDLQKSRPNNTPRRKTK